MSDVVEFCYVQYPFDGRFSRAFSFIHVISISVLLGRLNKSSDDTTQPPKTVCVCWHVFVVVVVVFVGVFVVDAAAAVAAVAIVT